MKEKKKKQEHIKLNTRYLFINCLLLRKFLHHNKVILFYLKRIEGTKPFPQCKLVWILRSSVTDREFSRFKHTYLFVISNHAQQK